MGVVDIGIVILCVDTKKNRRLELIGEGGIVHASIIDPEGTSELIELQAEALTWVLYGITYQSVASYGHIMLRLQGDSVAIEFRGAPDPAVCRCTLATSAYLSLVREINPGPLISKKVELL